MTEPNTSNKQSACPACEYERGSAGRPVLENGLMKCLDCGSSWRELGNSLEHILKDTAYEAKSKETLNTQPIYQTEEATLQSTSLFAEASLQARGYWAIGKSNILAALLGILFIASLLFALTSLPQASQSTHHGQLQISKVDVTEQMRSQGSKVFTVKGTLQNHSANQKHIPSITIVLRQTNGREVIRWNYNSPTKRIQPGKKLTFASSIQYDTPYVAYAEAILN